MKHVVLRFLFVKDLKYLEPKILLISEPKVLDVNTHRYLCWTMGVGPANQAVEERSVGLLNAWKGLRTLVLGLAQWAQENSTSMNSHELRI